MGSSFLHRFLHRPPRVFDEVELVRNVIAHAQKPDLVFQRNGRVHLNRRGFQFSRLLAADACASAVVMLDRPSSDTVQDCWLPTPLAYFPFTSPPVRHRLPSDSERAIHTRTSWCQSVNPKMACCNCQAWTTDNRERGISMVGNG